MRVSCAACSTINVVIDRGVIHIFQDELCICAIRANYMLLSVCVCGKR